MCPVLCRYISRLSLLTGDGCGLGTERVMEKWYMSAKRADFQAISKKFGIDPVIARVMRNRGIVGDEAIRMYLYGDLSDLNDPFLFKDMDKAVKIIREKIRERQYIRVIGDYDIDGIMSSYILRRGLTELGGYVDIKIPDRVTDGYGINEKLIREAKADGVDTIITCDNGISAGRQIALGKELGMTMIVTDHHEVLELPEACDCVIDAKQKDCPYPYKELCGAGVAWKLILALGGDPEYKMLPYAAFATVGDIVDLTGENRILVKEGLARMKDADSLGFRKLAAECGVDLRTMDAYHIGFVMGPCLNASGRLDTAMRAARLLETSDVLEAERLAHELKELNDSRKSLTEIGVEQAVAFVEESGMAKDKIFVIYQPELHESLAGIVAGRIRERYAHPVFVLTRGEEGIKGSGRSVEAYHMFEGLCGVKDLLTKFGGHPMAAGLTLPEENIEAFRKRLNEQCTLPDEEFCEKIVVDVPMPVGYVTEELVSELSLLAPFGKANEKPVFAEKNAVITSPRIVGRNRNVLKARVTSSLESGYGVQGPVEMVSFHDTEALMERISRDPRMTIAYYPRINEYLGRKTLQIVVSHWN